MIDSLIKFKVYEGTNESLAGDTTEQRRYFLEFANRYSDKELINLCAHQRPVIRCFSFRALVDKCNFNVFKILIDHLSDTTEFSRFYGCLSGSERVADNFLDAVGYYEENPTEFILTNEQPIYLDSVLLFTPEIMMKSFLGGIELRSRSHMLDRIKPVSNFYSRIREIASAGVYEALPLLAKYKNPADTSIFINYLLDDEFSNRGRTMTIYTRKALRYFPNPAFYPILKRNLRQKSGLMLFGMV